MRRVAFDPERHVSNTEPRRAHCQANSVAGSGLLKERVAGIHQPIRLDRQSVPGKRSGAWVFKGTRMPVAAVFENLQDMSVHELVEEFGVTREQVQAVLEFEAHRAEAPAPCP
ncbi:MAG: DUF433 domain-containing protein [Terriglobia bacterium]